MNQLQNSSLPEGIDIKARQMNFQHIKDKPRHWHHGDPFMTHMLTSASIFFPEGERFFIRSVRNYQDQITDPKLQSEIRGFMAQEATHGDEHEKYNQDVIEQGYKFLGRVEKLVKYALAGLNKFSPKMYQLATTVALEHITAIGANALLENPELMKGVEPEYKEIWYWHAIEETEHKAVAFDVYNAIEGKHWVKVFAMVMASLTFIPGVIFLLGRFLIIDGKLFDKSIWSGVKDYHQGMSPAFQKLKEDYLAFYKKDFHPWQLDNSELVKQWKETYEKTGKAAVA